MAESSQDVKGSAECDQRVVGHILFSPVVIAGEQGVIRGMGLAPMAVLPAYQRQGIGSTLVHHGLTRLRHASCPYVVVLGPPEYYPRFGFEPASPYNVRSQWEGIPDDAFMILVLDKSIVEGVSGIARYRDEFDAAI
jgi:putative acetyltransferase